MHRKSKNMRNRTQCVGLTVWASVVGAGLLSASEPVDYLRDIKPLLADKCFSCHSGLKQEASLRLDAIDLIRQGGDSGAAIAPGDGLASLIVERVSAEDADLRMPPPEAGHPLTADQIRLLASWIDAGAAAPDEAIPADPRDHWAFQPPQAIAVPDADAAWVRNEIDRFLADEHQRRGLVAVGPGPRSLLLRRLYLDLIGLPPTGEELQTFLDDETPGAWESAVDRLLDSPRYGERWARHFMDIWRYSDPSGYGNEIRDGREHLWRWRDWIVESLNADKPYDRMLVEMLAADEVAPDDVDAARATGFLARNWYKFNRNVWLDNIVEHSSKAFLGLTLNCARCHDHKYDPISHHEYYQMRAFFEPHEVRDDPFGAAESAMVVRAFDAKAETVTYPFLQGDENRPDKEHPALPAVPEVLGGKLTIEPVTLPVTAYYPALREENRGAALAAAEARLAAARAAVGEAEEDLQAARRAADEAIARTTGDSAGTKDQPSRQAGRPAGKIACQDDFSSLDPLRWTVEGGQWTSRAGHLVQSDGSTNQYRLLTNVAHPRDFRARLKLRITGGEMWRSVGLGFDVHGQAMRAVYLSAVSGGSKVQATLQDDTGRWAYPRTGAKARDILLDRDYLVELAVRDRLLNVLIDGELQFAFTLPANRNPGKLAIFTFSATAEFDDLEVASLALDRELVADGSQLADATDDRADPASVLRRAAAQVQAERANLALAEAELASLSARTAAELAKFGLAEADMKGLAAAAGRAARLVDVRTHEQKIATARMTLAQLGDLSDADADAKKTKQADAARQVVEKETRQLAAALEKLEEPTTGYPPLGPIHPTTSTGRRLALARWITRPENPLTARVLVNHVWLRHFDAPLVERMFDFGLRSDRPPQANLLDWLAVKFMQDGWSLKALHRRIVMSGAYRFHSSAGPLPGTAERSPSSPTLTAEAAAANQRIDPDNRSLWRMNARRMEAEVARDSLLYLGGSLDVTMGGPPIRHTEGQTVLRRSLYFRQDKERQMTFLSLFDGAKVNECYRRKATVVPQQALAMFNSQIAWEQAGKLAERGEPQDRAAFVSRLFTDLLCRPATADELRECETFLATAANRADARRQLVLVILNHNDFVTVR